MLLLLKLFSLLLLAGLTYTSYLLSGFIAKHIAPPNEVKDTLNKYKYTLLAITALHFLLLPIMMHVLNNINPKDDSHLLFTYLYYLPICLGGLQVTYLLYKALHKKGPSGIISIIILIIYAVGFTIYALTGIFYNINFLSDYQL